MEKGKLTLRFINGLERNIRGVCYISYDHSKKIKNLYVQQRTIRLGKVKVSELFFDMDTIVALQLQ
jgi:hypothetical protein